MCYTDAYIRREEPDDKIQDESLQRTLDRIETALNSVVNEFDAIVVSGYSGAIPGAIIAHKLGKQLLVVRKDEDVSHGKRIEGIDYLPSDAPYIVLDDIVSSGATVARMLDKMIEYGRGLPKYMVLYRGTCWRAVNLTGGGRVEFTHQRDRLFVPRFLQGHL